MTTDELQHHVLQRELISHNLDWFIRLRDDYDAGIGYRRKLQQRKSWQTALRLPWYARLWKWLVR